MLVGAILECRTYTDRIVCNRCDIFLSICNQAGENVELLSRWDSFVIDVIYSFFFCNQAGENVEPMQVPSHAVFQPSRKQMEAIKDLNRDFLGKSKVRKRNKCHYIY